MSTNKNAGTEVASHVATVARLVGGSAGKRGVGASGTRVRIQQRSCVACSVINFTGHTQGCGWVRPQGKGRPAKANGTVKRTRTDRRAAQSRGVVDPGVDSNGYAGYGNGYGNGYDDTVYAPSAAGAAPAAYGGGWPATADGGVDPSLYVVRAMGRQRFMGRQIWN